MLVFKILVNRPRSLCLSRIRLNLVMALSCYSVLDLMRRVVASAICSIGYIAGSTCALISTAGPGAYDVYGAPRGDDIFTSGCNIILKTLNKSIMLPHGLLYSSIYMPRLESPS
jgi:hypothetical protein